MELETTSDDEEELGGCPRSARCSSPTELREAEAGRWRQARDPATQQSYFYNEASRRTSWEAPVIGAEVDGGDGSTASAAGVTGVGAIFSEWCAARDRLSTAQSALLEMLEHEQQLLGAAPPATRGATAAATSLRGPGPSRGESVQVYST